MPEGESSYTNLQTTQWRAITYDYPILATYSDFTRLYCLTDFQAAWLSSNMPYYNWKTRWVDNNATQLELNEQMAELEYALMTPTCIPVYELQYIYDDIQLRELQALQDRYDAGGIPDVNPSTPTDFYSGDDSLDRLNALCTACKIYVYSYAQNWLTKASIGLGIAVIVGLAASITIVGGIIASVLVGGLAYITSIAMNAMQDKEALDDVACCMYSNLDGLAITSGNFELALDGCSFSPGSNQAIIRDIIASDLDQFSNWLSFIDQLGSSYDLAQIGVIDCPCTDPTWSQTLVSNSDFSLMTPVIVPNANPSNCIGGFDINIIDSCYVSLSASSTVGLRVEVAVPLGSVITDISFDVQWVALRSIGGMFFGLNTDAVSNATGNSGTKTITYAGLSYEDVTFFFEAEARANIGDASYVHINEIRVSGTGVNPFV